MEPLLLPHTVLLSCARNDCTPVLDTRPVTTSRFTDMPDLASERLGSTVLLANDEFFAAKENLIKVAPPIANDEYTERGKWMDGWETRRRRESGYDWCIIKLGIPGVLHGVIVDTANFKGNYPAQCSLEACNAPAATLSDFSADAVRWCSLLERRDLRGDAPNSFELEDRDRVTHLRLNIYPDGGVARLRVHGVPAMPPESPGRTNLDLAALENGGYVVSCSDMFFGNRHHLIMPGPSRQMNEGWETKRRRGPGNDWAIVRLCANGTVTRAEVDTSYFKGNAPGWCSLEAATGEESTSMAEPASGTRWTELLPKTLLTPHTRHFFTEELRSLSGVTHVRLNIFPDGGVARLRLWGTLTGGVNRA